MNAGLGAAVRVALVGICWASWPVTNAAADSPAVALAEYAPADAFAAIGVSRGATCVADLKTSALWDRARQSPLYAIIRKAPQYKQALTGLNVLQATTQLTGWDAAAAILGDEALLLVSPRGKEPARGVALLAMAQHTDKARLATIERVLKQIHIATGLLIDDEPDPERTFKVGDTVVWQTDGDIYHAYHKGIVFLSNSKSVLRQAVERATGAREKQTESPLWKQSLEHLSPRADAWAMLDMKVFRRMIPQKVWPPPADNPLGALLFSDWSERLRDATVAVASLSADSSSVVLNARLACDPSAKRKATTTTFIPLDSSTLPRGLMHYTVAADFERWWNRREKTMNEVAIADFGKFAGVMTTLMGGLDFSDEFLPNVVPGAQLLLARQTFADRATPSPVLPAFGLIFRLKPGSKIGARLDSAATMALSFLNLDAGQKGEAQFLINVEEYRGHKVTWTQYPQRDANSPGASQPADASDSRPAGIRYNFEPAMTRAGDMVIIATSRELARDLVDAIQKRGNGSSAPTDAAAAAQSIPDQISVSAESLRRILNDNRDQFVAQQMLKDDRPRAEAERLVDALLGLTDWFGGASITATAGQPSAAITLRLELK